MSPFQEPGPDLYGKRGPQERPIYIYKGKTAGTDSGWIQVEGAKIFWQGDFYVAWRQKFIVTPGKIPKVVASHAANVV